MIRAALVFTMTVALLFSCAKRDPIDLRETFNPADARPMGAKVAHSMLSEAWPEAYVSEQKYRLSQSYFGSDSNRLYVSISRNFYSDAEDVNVLYDFVRKGNTALIVTANPDSSLQQMLGCRQRTDYAGFFTQPQYFDQGTYYSQQLAHHSGYTDTAKFLYLPVRHYLEKKASEGARIISFTDTDSVNCMVFFIGQGRLYLHSEPQFFSNYFLLQRNNARYLETLFRILPENINTIYADDYYWQTNTPTGTDKKSKSSLSAVLASPPLAAAFWIALALFLLYLLFNSKRRQRIIPVQQKETNSSVAFVEAMSRLYLGKKDNKVVAMKMIAHFHESVRSRYFTSLNPRDDGYAAMLAGKTGARPEHAQRAADLMKQILLAYRVSDQELLDLNSALEKINQSR